MAWYHSGELDTEFNKKYGVLFVELDEIAKEIKHGITSSNKIRIKKLREKFDAVNKIIDKEQEKVSAEITRDIQAGYTGLGHPEHEDRAVFLGKKAEEVRKIIAQLDAWLSGK